jgi:HYR domain
MHRAILIAALCALLVPLGAFAVPGDPVVTVPADMTVEAQSLAGATVTYTASAVDRDGNPIPVTCSPESGSVFGLGRTTVTCTARDRGRTATKQFDITVVDSQPPTITVPAPQRVSTTVRSGKVVGYTASASDVVDGTVAVACAPASGARFPVGTTTVNCTAADSRNNPSAAAFTVTVVFKATRTTRSTMMLAPRAGATVRTAPMLRWRPVPKARFYNVQLFRRGQKVLTVWPSRPHFRLQPRWTFRGHAYRLRRGSYTWLVWPAYGTLAKPRYGKLLGQSSFVFAKPS